MTEETSTPKVQPRRKLGRGLGALLGEVQREEPLVRSATPTGPDKSSGSTLATDGPLRMLPVSAIEPHPEQPRRYFAEDALEELAGSIAARGVIQPVIVRPLAGDRYQLVAGERRWRAAQKARLHEIPCLVRDLDEGDVMALALIENIQREDLNPVEEAQAYRRLSDSQGLTQAEIAQMVDKSRSHVANLQRLLDLPAAVLELVASEKLSMGHARALIGQDDAEDLANQTVAKRLTVRQVEKLVRRKKAPSANSPVPANAREDADIAAVQKHLEEFLGLPVKIAPDTDPRSGAVTIRYRTLDQLDLVCQRLTGGEF